MLLLSGDSAEALEEAWPEYAPIAVTEDKESFERMIEEKSTGKIASDRQARGNVAKPVSILLR